MVPPIDLAGARDAEALQRALSGATDVPPQIARLADTAGAVASLPVPGPSPDFVASLGARLAAEAAAPAGHVDTTAVPSNVISIRRTWPKAVAGTAAGLVAASTVLGIASQDALPGGLLYGVRGVVDGLEVAVAGSDAARGTALLAQGREHVTDAETLVARDPQSAADISTSLDDAAATVTSGEEALFTAFDRTKDPAHLAAVKDFTTWATPRLDQLAKSVPAESRTHLSALSAAVDAGEARLHAALASCGQACASVTPISPTTVPGARPTTGAPSAPAGTTPAGTTGAGTTGAGTTGAGTTDGTTAPDAVVPDAGSPWAPATGDPWPPPLLPAPATPPTTPGTSPWTSPWTTTTPFTPRPRPTSTTPLTPRPTSTTPGPRPTTTTPDQRPTSTTPVPPVTPTRTRLPRPHTPPVTRTVPPATDPAAPKPCPGGRPRVNGNCGQGGNTSDKPTPTPKPTPTRTPTPSVTPTRTPTPSTTPSAPSTPAVTPTPSATPTTPSVTPSSTPTPGVPPTPSATPTTPAVTPTPSVTPTAVPSGCAAIVGIVTQARADGATITWLDGLFGEDDWVAVRSREGGLRTYWPVSHTCRAATGL